MRAAARYLTVAISLCAWLAVSNHCVVNALVTKPHTASCPFHSKPNKPERQKAGAECCKILRAIPPAPAKELAPAIIDLFPADNAYHRLAILQPPKISLVPPTLDTGPPGKTSFVELNRSMRAHAPPVFV